MSSLIIDVNRPERLCNISLYHSIPVLRRKTVKSVAVKGTTVVLISAAVEPQRPSISKQYLTPFRFCFFVLFFTSANSMGLLLHCFMALSIVTLTTGFVTQPVSKPSGQTVFVMKSNLSLPSPNHRIQRRSAGQGASCSANQGSLSTLTDNTRSVSHLLFLTDSNGRTEDDTQVQCYGSTEARICILNV